jgi:TolA-binding protein
MNFLNTKNISILGSLILVIGVGSYFVQQSNESKEQASKNALFAVQKNLDTEMAALSAEEKVPGSKIDVQVKFPKTVTELQAMLTDQKYTRNALFGAAMILGNLYSDHPFEQSSEKAIATYKKAVDFAHTSFQKSTAQYLLGMVYEQQNQLKEAEEMFKAGLASGYEGMKGEMMLSLVRVSVKNKNAEQAKTLADKLNKEQPGSRAAQEAQKLISKS